MKVWLVANKGNPTLPTGVIEVDDSAWTSAQRDAFLGALGRSWAVKLKWEPIYPDIVWSLRGHLYNYNDTGITALYACSECGTLVASEDRNTHGQYTISQ